MLLAIVCFSCNNVPTTVTTVLQQSGSNKKALDSVISYYKYEGNIDKLQATYFLIGNMADKFSYDGEAVRSFDPIFSMIDSLRRQKVKITIESPVLRAKWDSLVKRIGAPNIIEADSSKDYSKITAGFLIENIDVAYTAWKSAKWSTDVSFDQFCEYILPYRVGTERLEPWRKYLYAKYKPFRDTAKYENSYDLAVAINKRMRKEISLNHIVEKYPFNMTVRQMEQARLGACKHLVFYEAMVMRANGIPVSIELSSLWGDLNRGHEWLSLLKQDGTHYAFNAAQDEFSMKAPFRFAKVYRVSFTALHKDIPHSNDVPAGILNDYRIDVTSEYTKTYDIDVPLKYKPLFDNQHAIICTFNNYWAPQDWGGISNEVAHFKNMGSNLVYNVMYYNNNQLTPASDPFILDSAGRLLFFKPGSGQDMVLTRKFPNSPLNTVNGKVMIGGKLQGANKPDFSDAADLYQITAMPVRYESVAINNKQRFRYVRYLTAAKQKTNLAELEFYGVQHGSKDTIKLAGTIKGHPEISPEIGTPYQNAFDGKPETYFSGDKDSTSWAGLDLGKAQRIVKIRYCPRSDSNFILPGDTYELCVWQNNKWLSLGKQTAQNSSLTFRAVPSNQLYILHDLTRGKEERIFTYTNGKQVWW